MKKGSVLFIFCLMFLGLSCFAQTPPPNDNFTNAILLSGDDLTFSGSLAGATLENDYDGLLFTWNLGAVNGSVWWKWVAQTNTQVTIETLSEMPLINQDVSYGQSNFPPPLDEVIVYTATNGNTTLSNLVAPIEVSNNPASVAAMAPIDTRAMPVVRSFGVTAGNTYFIQLVGRSTSSYNMRLIATNVPVIVQQPYSQPVASNDSTLFYVLYSGSNQLNFTSQWLFNGTPLTNQNAAILLLTNVNGAMAGNYSVIVSDGGLSTTSTVATLTVAAPNTQFSLTALGSSSNLENFSITGENGRYYRIVSSPDLVNWSNETSFGIVTGAIAQNTSIVLNTNSPTVFSVTNNGTQKFFRATPYVAPDADSTICENNLRALVVAKNLWSRDYYYANLYQGNPVFGEFFGINDTPMTSKLQVYFANQKLPVCPDDTNHAYASSYYANFFRGLPYCQIKPQTHVVQIPQ